MQPTWQSDCGTISLYWADCLDVLPHVDADVVLADPPYGIAYDPASSSQQGIQKFSMVCGDDGHFDPSPLLDYEDAILWGCNNYCDKIPPHGGQWYFWDKVTRNALKVRIAEGEYCWHKQGTKPRAFRHLWSGAYRASESGCKSVHPTQKPIALMEWCLSMLADGVVLDPFMGSGTTGIACIRKDRRFIGIEKEKKYFDIAVERISAELSRMPLLEGAT